MSQPDLHSAYDLWVKKQKAKTRGKGGAGDTVCRFCVTADADPLVRCIKCNRSYHKKCIKEHQRQHREDARKLWNYRHFWDGA